MCDGVNQNEFPLLQEIQLALSSDNRSVSASPNCGLELMQTPPMSCTPSPIATLINNPTANPGQFVDDNNNIPLTISIINNQLLDSPTRIISNDINNNNNNHYHTGITTGTNNSSTASTINSTTKMTILLPEILESLHKSEYFPTNRHRWNTNEEIAAFLISIDQHEKWLSEEVKLRYVRFDSIDLDLDLDSMKKMFIFYFILILFSIINIPDIFKWKSRIIFYY